MLPREHRLTSSRDHRDTMRQGVRAGGGGVMVAVRFRAPSSPRETSWRCGLVVSKAVGNAVVRHRIQRRLRHIVFGLMREGAVAVPTDARLDMVIRAFPEIVDLDHLRLRAEVLRCAQRALQKSSRKAEKL
ncbi:ribonuclease P protein component [Nesterenkonia lutea]|uniref:Ribonuclease P protein component n=1 Tax=Nesterenkonia lutea TaxID=272919 RepID=A0ABR9JH27_9MICC|nr:ribonuclease P protein component [Nesterenkonia lutea]MBE1525214.1 ribonuclease P protein component [Nesterenkonia lutea]